MRHKTKDKNMTTENLLKNVLHTNNRWLCLLFPQFSLSRGHYRLGREVPTFRRMEGLYCRELSNHK